MHYLTLSELTFAAGIICGAVAGLAFLVVPALWRALIVAILAWLAWRLTQVPPHDLGIELLDLARRAAAQRDFIQGALMAKAGIALTAFLLRRRAR